MRRWRLLHVWGVWQLRLGPLWISAWDRHIVIWHRRRRVLRADWWWKDA